MCRGGGSMLGIIYQHLCCARWGKVSVPAATDSDHPLPFAFQFFARRRPSSQRGIDSYSQLMSHQVFLWNNWGGRRGFLRGQFPKKRRPWPEKSSGEVLAKDTARRIIWNPSTWWKRSHCPRVPPIHFNRIAFTYTQTSLRCSFCQHSAWLVTASRGNALPNLPLAFHMWKHSLISKLSTLLKPQKRGMDSWKG